VPAFVRESTLDEPFVTRPGEPGVLDNRKIAADQVLERASEVSSASVM
jgi:hypothetical protein